MTSSISVERFWSLVEEIDWATRQTQPIAEGKRFLRQRLSREEASDFDEHLQIFRFALHDVLNDYMEETGEEFETGDDGLDDFICHIIGLGRREYEAATANPRFALERAESGDYPESFRYLVPSPDDYE